MTAAQPGSHVRCLGFAAGLFTFLVLATVTSASATQASAEAERRFVDRVFTAVRTEDRAALHDVVAEAPARALTLCQDLLRSSLEETADSERMGVARALAREHGDVTGSSVLSDAVARQVRLLAEARADLLAFEDQVQAAVDDLTREQWAAGESRAQEALAIARDLELPYRTAKALGLLAHLLRRQGKLEEAREAGQEALAVNALLGAEREQIEDARRLGEIERQAGARDRALEYFSQALEQARLLEDSTQIMEAATPLALLEIRAGSWDVATRHLEEALAAARRNQDPRHEAFLLASRGSLESGRGRHADALRWLGQARVVAVAAGDRVAEGRAWTEQGGLYSEIGMQAEAESCLDRALELLAADQNPGERGLALVSLGLVRLDGGQPARALEPLEEGQALLQRSGLRAGVASALQHRATCLLALGEAAAAESLLCQSLALFEAEGDLFQASLCETLRGRCQEAAGDDGAARERYEAALRRAAALDSPELRWRANLGLGRGREAGGETAVALQIYRLAIADVEQIRQHLTLPSLQLRYLGDKRDLYRRAARLAQHAGEEEDAFRMAEAVKARTLIERGVAGGSVEAAGNPLRRCQKALAADRALLQFLVGEATCMVWVVRRESVHYHELTVSREALREDVQRILSPLQRLADGCIDLATLPFDSAAAHRLYTQLLEPLGPDLAGCSTLLLVPDGPLRELPFALLVTEHHKRKVEPATLFAQYRGHRFLIEERALGYLPVAAWLGRDGSTSPLPTGRTLIVADPSPLPARAPELPGSRREMLAVAVRASFAQGRLLTGAHAREDAVKRALVESSWVHFAVHGELNGHRPESSRLALAPAGSEDGWLHAYEIAELSLPAPRVVLSACESRGSAGRGEGLLGLTHAFLQAGARSVLATAWPVDDQTCADLFEFYYRHLDAGLTSLEALQRSQVEFLRGPPHDGRHPVHPFFWAGFLHVGD